MVLTKPKMPLTESPEVDYAAFKGWARMTGPLVQETGEMEGLASFFLPRRFPFKEFQKLQEENLTEISEMNEATPQPRSRIYGELFRISTRRNEFDRARDSIGKSMYEAAETKKEDEDALFAKIMKIKGDTEEIKNMIRRMDKDSEPTPRERGAARSDLTTNLGVEDELLEEVRTGLLPR
jgi:hypothetical protein